MPDPRAASNIIPVLLVVEDEPLLRMLAMDIAEEAGFTVVAASNADDAVLILESRTDIRIVFTDIDMPGSLDGIKLAACVRDRWPPIRIILTSGHAKPLAADMPEGSVFFAKPYRQDRVIDAMRRMAAQGLKRQHQPSVAMVSVRRWDRYRWLAVDGFRSSDGLELHDRT